MADIDVVTATVPDAIGGTVALKEKFVDQGDGTHARKLVAELDTGDVVIGSVVSPNVSTATAFTGQITVTTAGTAVQGPNVPLTNGAWIMGHPGNGGNVAYGNDGANDVTMDNGVILEPGRVGPPVQVANLNELWFDAAGNGYKFCWQKG